MSPLSSPLQIGPWRVDLRRRTMASGQAVQHLTPTEVTLLQRLAAAGGRPVSRSDLLHEVWGYSDRAQTRAVDHAVHRLRAKLSDNAYDAAAALQTVRGHGYALVLASVDGGPAGRIRDALTSSARAVVVAAPPGIGLTRALRTLAAEPGAVYLRAMPRHAGPLLLQLTERLGEALGHRLPLASDADRIATVLIANHVQRVLIDDAGATADELAPLLRAWHRHPLRVVCAAPGPISLPSARQIDLLGVPTRPDRHADAVAQAIARLDADAMHLLRCLSLLGSVTLRAAVALYGQRAVPFDTALATLRRARLLDGPLEVGATVRSAAQPEAIAALQGLQLPAPDLLGPSRLGRLADLLAATDPGGAAALWVAASRPLLLSGPAYVGWMERAVAVAPPGPSVAAARVLRGALRHLSGDLAGARADLDVEGAGADAATEAERRVRRGWLALHEGEATEAIAQLIDARSAARRAGAGDVEAMAEIRLASAHHRCGEVDAAQAALYRAIGLYEGLDDAPAAARARASLAMMLVEQGDTAPARDLLLATIAEEEARGDVAAVAQHRLNLGALYLEQGQPDRATAELQRAAGLARSVGDVETEGLAWLSAGSAALIAGDASAAAAHLAHGRVLLQRADARLGLAIAWAYSALAAALLDDEQEWEAALRAADVAAHPGGPALQQLLERVRAAPAALHSSSWCAPSPASVSFVRLVDRVITAARARPHVRPTARRTPPPR